MKKISKYGIPIVLSLLIIYTILSIRDITNSAKTKLAELNTEQYKIIDSFTGSKINKLASRHKSISKEKSEFIISYDDVFYVEDSNILLRLDNSIISFKIRGSHYIETSTTSPSAIIDDVINISLTDKDKIEYDVSVTLYDDAGTLYVVAQRRAGNTGVIASMPTSDEKEAEDRLFLQSIIDSAAAPYDKSFTLFDIQLKNISDILIYREAVVLTDKDGNNIYIYPSNIECKKAGLTKELKTDTLVFNYGDFTDKETNYSIYVTTINKKQFKFLCSSKEILSNIFSEHQGELTN